MRSENETTTEVFKTFSDSIIPLLLAESLQAGEKRGLQKNRNIQIIFQLSYYIVSSVTFTGRMEVGMLRKMKY